MNINIFNDNKLDFIPQPPEFKLYTTHINVEPMMRRSFQEGYIHLHQHNVHNYKGVCRYNPWVICKCKFCESKQINLNIDTNKIET